MTGLVVRDKGGRVGSNSKEAETRVTACGEAEGCACAACPRAAAGLRRLDRRLKGVVEGATELERGCGSRDLCWEAAVACVDCGQVERRQGMLEMAAKACCLSEQTEEERQDACCHAAKRGNALKEEGDRPGLRTRAGLFAACVSEERTGRLMRCCPWARKADTGEPRLWFAAAKDADIAAGRLRARLGQPCCCGALEGTTALDGLGSRGAWRLRALLIVARNRWGER